MVLFFQFEEGDTLAPGPGACRKLETADLFYQSSFSEPTVLRPLSGRLVRGRRETAETPMYRMLRLTLERPALRP